MAVFFESWLFGKFPYRYKKEDTYKDGNGKGIFERFLNALGKELDEEVMPYLEGHLDILDPITVNDDLLTYLAAVLGNPPDTLKDESKYRLLLKYITILNRLKGTVKDYDLLFEIFGVTVTLTEAAITRLLYDNSLSYDDGELYDRDCPLCTCYEIAISDPDGNYPAFGTLDDNPDLKDNFFKLVRYIEPIDMQLCAVTYNGDSITLGGAYLSEAYSYDYDIS